MSITRPDRPPGKREPAPAVLLAHLLEAQRVHQEIGGGCRVSLQQADAMEPANLVRLRHYALCPRREIAGVGGLDQRQSQPVRIGKGEQTLAEARPRLGRLHPMSREPLGPILEAAGRNSQRHLDGESDSGLAWGHVRPGEERQVGAGMRRTIGVEEMVGPRHVLVDGLLDQPHAQDSNVEVQILLRVAGDDGDVMQAGDVVSHGVVPRLSGR